MRKAKVDRNQPLAVAALRALGFLVQPTHTLGGGAPDFIVLGVLHGEMIDSCRLVWVELKCGAGKLTLDEVEWHETWNQYPVVIIASTVAEILKAFRWTNDEIHVALDKLPNNPAVRAALRKTERKYGTPEPDVMATIKISQP
jgi:hypothetical protein